MFSSTVTHFQTTGVGSIDWRAQRARAEQELALFGADIPLHATVKDLSPVHQAMVAIARALGSVSGEPGSRLLVLDEPTVYLPRHEVATLFDAVRAFTKAGDAVLFVSHRIDEVLELTDHVTVLRGGKVAGSARTLELSEDDIVAMIVGAEMDRSKPVDEDRADGEADTGAVLSGLSSRALHGAELEIRRGEVLGVTGLAGSGFEELLYVLGGAAPGSGSIELRTNEGLRAIDVASLDERAAIRSGIVLVPADRPRLGVLGEASIRENVSLPWLKRFSSGGVLRTGAERRWVDELLQRFNVRFGGVEDAIQTLSGGNQQKAVIAKWLSHEPDVVLLHEPTQGVDIGGRFDIYEQLRAAAARGAVVIAASESPEELAELCDRVAIFRDGRVSTVLSGADVDKHRIVEATVADRPEAA